MTTATRQPLDRALRRALESTVIKARDVAEEAAIQALKRLAVPDAKPAQYLDEAQRDLRNRLRAHGRQLGDIKAESGQQSIHKLVTEVAYQHWHRMLFARFLEQNQLLMYDSYTALTLTECDELAREKDTARDELERRCASGWELAGVLASKMLPQVFHIDSPVFELELAPEHQRALEQLVIGLDLDTFQAQDSLGWVYQFWQSKRKEEVNKSEVKIGADELSPVTQLFTEPYMVSFLLDNSLGAWWAGQRLSENDRNNAQSERELREKAAIPGVPLNYLRLVKSEETQQWQPASGTFDAWPKQLGDFKALDPCCGSGHFLVAAFLMLVPMRMQLEGLGAKQAIDLVLRENLHGLELDQRCVELAAFAVALEAWRFPAAGGYRNLPELNLACSGLSITAAREEWKELGKKANKQNLSIALDWMYQTFKEAPVLGSLINPRRSKAAKIVPWGELQQLLGDALAQEETDGGAEGESSAHNNRIEAGIVAQGLAKAAELLSGQYTWVVTNVPYLARGKQHDTLKEYCEANYPEAKNDLATVFLDRCLEFCVEGGTASIVLPQNWLFLTSYRKFREKLLQRDTWQLVVKLGGGAEAFEVGPGNITNIAMISIAQGNSADQSADLLHSGEPDNWIRGLDVSEPRTAEEKALLMSSGNIDSLSQAGVLNDENIIIYFGCRDGHYTLGDFAKTLAGVDSGDSNRFMFKYWELDKKGKDWIFQANTVESSCAYGGMEGILLFEGGKGAMADCPGGAIRNQQYWGQEGITLSTMNNNPASLNRGYAWCRNVAGIVPKHKKHYMPIWTFCSSDSFTKKVREINQKLRVAEATFSLVSFDIDLWTSVAAKQYPHGLPQPYTNDPTQWIFHGYPCGSVIWDQDSKWTANGELREDDSVLHVAVARLLGYRWPAELDPEMELATEQRAWVERCAELLPLADDDGIVCLPAVRGEKAADQRLERMLEAAYGQAWTTPLKNRLLDAVGSRSLEHWLRDKFFEQHCKLFQHRPFIWHIWDGLKDGFSALVNYHKLDKARLERLTYTYLGDWITTQQSALTEGVDGADARLSAAQTLKSELEAILKGEAPYDIFVRWKPLEEQPIGWEPDLNDGVRLNIRPFLKARDLGKKDAGILRWKPNIHWKKDRGKDVESAPWYTLGLEYEESEGARINDHHLTLEEKRKARERKA